MSYSVVYWHHQLLEISITITYCCLLIKDTITLRNMGNCLIMYVVYFGRTYYGILSCGFHHGEPRWLSIQLSVVRIMPGLRCYTSCLLCEVVVFSYLGLAIHPDSALGVLDRGTGYARYPSKTHALHWQAVTTTIISFNMWENGCGMGTQLSTILVKLMIINQASDIW